MWSCKSDMVTDGHRKLLENMEWMHEEELLIRPQLGTIGRTELRP